jgi:hypothetical protein
MALGQKSRAPFSRQAEPSRFGVINAFTSAAQWLAPLPRMHANHTAIGEGLPEADLLLQLWSYRRLFLGRIPPPGISAG